MTRVSIEYDVPVEMRDGTILRADVYRPEGAGPWPVIVSRGPYSKDHPWVQTFLQPLLAAKRGFMVVVQDTRSRFLSDGDEWRPWINEGPEGADTVEWAARLPDSTGRVAMLGPSYLGNVQWMAAIEKPEGLVAISPSYTWSDPDDGVFGRGGAIELGLSAAWSLGQGADVVIRRHADDVDKLGAAIVELIADYDGLAHGVYAELPAGRHPVFERHQIPELGYEAALVDPAVAAACRVAGRHGEVEVPSLTTGGWLDIFSQGSLDNYIAASRTQPARLIMGPWSHSEPMGAPVQGEMNFGFAAGMEFVNLEASWADMQLEWLSSWLLPEGEAAAPAPKVKIFVMGINQWRDEDEWPLSRAVETPWYLGDGGTLSPAPAASPSTADFVYDPMNPVPTLGGALLMSPEYPAGVFDQAKVEARADVLLYTSAPLDDDLEVTGRVRAVINATTDGPSTDWVVRLCDVDANGVSRNVTDGILRAETVPNMAGEFEVDLWSTSMVFAKGHRLRVQVTSSCFPRWDRNLNTGEPAEVATTPRVAHQRVHHGSGTGSRIVLPVVPRDA